MKKTVNITNPQNCVACTGCVNICPVSAIKLCPDKEGFAYPFIEAEKCTACGLCVKVCPMEKVKDEYTPPVAYMAKSNDIKILQQSSSGGIFYFLAKEVIKNNGVVFGAALSKDVVEHIGIEKKEDLPKLMGSKYVQSDLNETFRIIKNRLTKNQKVLFVGTPCQVAGLYSFLGNRHKDLITVDFICHGVPSPSVFKRYVTYIENKFNKKICDVQFRSKKISWSRFSLAVKFTDNTEFVEEFTLNSYMKGFINNLFLRPSCHDCRFKEKNHFGDITIGDFWGIKNVKPELDTESGVSLCCINTQNGADWFENIKKQLLVESVSFDEAIKYNTAYTKSVKPNRMREWFFKHLDKEPIDKNINNSLNPSLFMRLLLKIQKRKYLSEKWN